MNYYITTLDYTTTDTHACTTSRQADWYTRNYNNTHKDCTLDKSNSGAVCEGLANSRSLPNRD